MTNPPTTPTKRPTLERRHWVLLLTGLVVLFVYGFFAAAVLPQWLVSLTAGGAGEDTKLSAVTNTRAALLSVFVPIVILFGGLAAFLNYRETVEQNRRINGRARIERDEARRLRRAEVYAAFLSACQESWNAALDLYAPEREDPAFMLNFVHANRDKRDAMDLAHDRVMLLGAEEVQASATALNSHVGIEVVTKANARPRVSKEEWDRITIPEYATRVLAFREAARQDLAPTR